MTQCRYCVLDDQKFSGVKINREGLCDLCEASKVQEVKLQDVKELERLFSEIKGKFEYDCLVPFSGGKDGAYLLHTLKSKYGLRILAYTFDSGFTSDQTKHNLDLMQRIIGFDHVTMKTDWLLTKDLYARLIKMQGAICIACEMFLFAFAHKLAEEKKIPIVCWGLTPNQAAYIEEGIIDFQKVIRNYMGWQMLHKTILKAIFPDNRPRVDLIAKKYLHDKDFSEPYKNVFPFYFLGYDCEEVERIVSALGWKRPTDTGGCSSNCHINHLHIHLQKQLYGEEDYALRLSKKIRTHDIKKDIALKALTNKSDDPIIAELLNDLEISLSVPQLIDHIKNQTRIPELEEKLKLCI